MSLIPRSPLYASELKAVTLRTRVHFHFPNMARHSHLGCFKAYVGVTT